MSSEPKKNTGILLAQLALVLTAGVFAVSDKILLIPGIPAQLAQLWPCILVAVTVVDRGARLMGDYFDDGMINNSFKALGLLILLGLASMFITGCVSLNGWGIGAKIEHTSGFGLEANYKPNSSGFQK